MQASAFRSSGQKRKMQHKGISFQMALGLGVHGLGVHGFGVHGFGVHGLGVHGLGALGLGCTASGRTAGLQVHMRRLQKKDGGVWFRSCI